MHKNAILFAIFLIISACANGSETIDASKIQQAKVEYKKASDMKIITIDYTTDRNNILLYKYCFYTKKNMYDKRKITNSPNSFILNIITEDEFNKAKQIARAWIAQNTNNNHA